MILLVSIIIVALPVTAGAQTWTEVGDAGDMIATASISSGSGPLTEITGSISIMPDHVDMYCINIPDLLAFAAYINCALISAYDLWLFDENGNGVTMNDHCDGGMVLISALYGSTPGQYYLAITATDDEAISSTGTIWDPPYMPGERMPDGPGAASPLTSWTNSMPLEFLPYSINLVGAEFCDNAVSAEQNSWGGIKARYR
ncbi:MAG: hypothetical protein GY893_14680 [bacterium]|nr:hypothetical protein [bacterium]